MDIIIVLIMVLVVFIILWLVFSKRRAAQKPVAYVCPNCGERHCDCYRKDENEPSDQE